MRRVVAGLLALVIIASSQAHAQGLTTVETDKLRLLYFDPTETYLVPRVIQSYHNSADRQESILGYSSDEKTTVLLTDFSDYGNAGANSAPRNILSVDVAPLSLSFETAAPAERMYTIMNHELVHITNTDQAAPADLRARRFFGGKVVAKPANPETILYQYLTTPRKSSPRWFLEGLAVFFETWMAGGYGRAQGYWDEMVFRAMVRDDARFYDPLGLVSEGVRVDFQGMTNAYLYGTRFITWLAYTYSPEQVVDWARRDEGSHRSYRSDFARVFGKPLDDAWQEWIAFEKDFQRSNLEAVNQYPTTDYEAITPAALGSVSKSYYDEQTNSLLAGFQFPGVIAHIGAIPLDGGKVEQIEEIKGAALYQVVSMAWDPQSRTIFYTTDNYEYRDLIALDRDTGKTRMLLKDARIGDLAFNRADRSLWGVRHLNGYASLVRIPYPYEQWNLVETFPYGTVIYDLDVSRDGQYLSASVGDIRAKHVLQVHAIEDLLQGEFEPEQLVDFGHTLPEGFTFSPDGRYLFGSSFYTGVSNLFRIDMETGEFEAVTNAETGFFRPVPLDNENLVAYTFTGQGFLPVSVNATPLEDVSSISSLGYQVYLKNPALQDWEAGSPDDIDAESRIVAKGQYVASKNLGRESMYPVVLGYKDSVSVGWKFNFSDKIQLDSLSITGAYSTDGDLPSDERPNVMVDYRHTVVSNSPLNGTWNFSAALNKADFYDLVGPTKRSRKGNRFTIGYEKTLLSDGPRSKSLSFDISHFSDMDALPRYQNVPTLLDSFSTFNGSWEYSNIRSSQGSVDGERGIRTLLGTSITHVEGDTVPQFLAELDLGFSLPLKNSSIWLRNAVGAADGDILDPFANFYFGGFGNNYLDRGAVKRYRQFYAMPGFELNEIGGKNFAKTMLEWNLPPYRFERAGHPGFYFTWARTSLFAKHLTTNLDDSAIRREVQSVGLQIDFRITILSRMNMTLSFGYARGFGDDLVADDDEFMASLKVL